MSSKIGLILSMIFVAMFFVFGIDLICIQFIYSDLDAKSITISYLISQNGGLSSDLINEIEDTLSGEEDSIVLNSGISGLSFL